MPTKISSEAALKAAVEKAKREALIEHVVANPGVTLAELVGLGGDLGKIAGSLTFRELTGRTAPTRAPSKRGRAAASTKTLDTKTPAGRAAYDSAVLKTLKSRRGEMSAPEIRAQCGGTPLQARASLDRLIADGKATYKGKARAMRYRAK